METKKIYYLLLSLAVWLTAYPAWCQTDTGRNDNPEQKYMDSQLKSELNLPRAGDELVKKQVVYCESGGSGENQTWDFSRRATINDKYIAGYYGNGNEWVTGVENETLRHYCFSGDSLLCTGYENPMTLVKYAQPQLLLLFPVKYGSSSQGDYNGRGKFCDRLELTLRGNVSTKADGWGQLILPEGDTLKNVLRVHTAIKSTQQTVPLSPGFDIHARIDEKKEMQPEKAEAGNDMAVIVENIYRWYSGGCRYPVFETLEMRMEHEDCVVIGQRSSFVYHPYEQEYYQADDSGNRLIIEKSLQQFHAPELPGTDMQLLYRIYPNPVSDCLQVTINPEENTGVILSLYDMHGRMLHQLQVKEAKGSHTETIDMKPLAKGNYLLRIQTGNDTVNEKIIKN